MNTDPDLEKILDFLSRLMGVDFESIGRKMVVNTIATSMRRANFVHFRDYFIHLENRPEEVLELIEELTIPETWFFRDGLPFEVLVKISIELLRSKAKINILSIPCSTGEEPYSIAMALLYKGIPRELFSIDAVDINSKSLAIARAGEYGSNSIRTNIEQYVRAYFLQSDSKYIISEEVKEQVNFYQENIVGKNFRQGRKYDIIFFRNLLIYLSNDARIEVEKRFDELLTPKGYLFSGHSEVLYFSGKGYEIAEPPGAFYLRKSTGSPNKPLRRNLDAGTSVLFKQNAPKAKQEVIEEKQKSKNLNNPIPKEKSTESDVKIIDSQMIRIKHHIERGENDLALIDAMKLIDKGTSSKELYFLTGLAWENKFQKEHALQMYLKAIYLDPEDYDILIHIALIYEELNNSRQAKIYRERAGRINSRRGE